MVDTGDLKSPGHCDRAGSSPAPGTTHLYGTIAKLVRPQPAKLLFAGSSPAGSSITIWVLSFLDRILFLQMSGDVRAVECAGLENR